MDRSLTPTNYALLGLLTLRREWPAYELVQQSQRNLRFLWPRAESKIYESAKRLVVLGLATTVQRPTGRRRRTMYSITPAGRRALKAWLREPSGGPALQFEGALKLFFAEQGTKRDALATIEGIEEWSRQVRELGTNIAREYQETDGGPFPKRLHASAIVTDLLWRHFEMIEDWARWARQEIESWDGTGPQPHRHDLDMEVWRRHLR